MNTCIYLNKNKQNIKSNKIKNQIFSHIDVFTSACVHKKNIFF